MAKISIKSLNTLSILEPLNETEATQVGGGLETTYIYVDPNGVVVGYNVIMDGKSDVVVRRNWKP